MTSWQIIKSALNQKNSGSKVIITTRNVEVANEEDVYKVNPLSRDDSKRLFYVRLFGGDGNCPANHPHEASEKILDKCGDIPLAIITMASLLVGKSREDWFDVCNSPGFYRNKGNKQVAHDTEWILSLSYYDLPSYLRSCLLYLSVYPEDYVIDKNALIWKWIAEGFVERKTAGTSLFQQGEEYFNQLINRSMIQGVESITGRIYNCRVHDMVLDLIRGLSNEENFVTISNDDEGTSTENTVRRLAHQNRMLQQAQSDNDIGMAHVRSLLACRCDIQSWALHPSLKHLRVLDLVECRTPDRKGWQGLEHLGKLLHLRYLGLRNTKNILELSEEIGKLKFLQVLDLQGSNIMELPLAVCELTQLIRLCGSFATGVPDGFLGKVTSLEELQNISIRNLDVESQRQFLKELGNQSELRVLNIFVTNRMCQSDLLQSLGNLQKLQDLTLWGYSVDIKDALWGFWDTAVLPRHLRHLELRSIGFRQLPSCISPAHLPCLYSLWLCVDHVDEEGLRALGGLPELCYLVLETRQPLMACTTTIVLGDGFFHKLINCKLDGWMIQLVANEDSTSVLFGIWNGIGAMAFGSEAKDECSRSVAPPLVMPNLQVLEFFVRVRALYKDGNGGCDNLGLECLPSLRRVIVYVVCDGADADQVEKAEAELKQAAQLHPIIQIERVNEVQLGLLDDRS